MRLRIMPIVGVGVVALTAASAFVPAANAQGSHLSLKHHASAHAATFGSSKATTCYDQSKDSSGSVVVSQNFTESQDDGYDSVGADDFVLKKACKVATVNVSGAYFNGTGPADNETVTFYADKKGKPSKAIATSTTKGKDTAGSFAIKLKKPVSLDKGTYWISVQANMDGTVGGEWGWEASATDQAGKPAVWQNPGDAFATGCTKWSNMQTCLGGTTGPDFLFSLAK